MSLVPLLSSGLRLRPLPVLVLNHVKNYASSSSPPPFKSSISLENLYPKSSLNIAKQPKIPESKDPNKFTGYIPIGTIERLDMSYEKYMHELKAYDGQTPEWAPATSVTIKFHVESADWIPQPIRENFLKKFRNVISSDGYFTKHSDRTFTRHMNTADAMEKLREMIRSCEPQKASIEPVPETQEMTRRKREKLTRETLRRKGSVQFQQSSSKT